MRGVSTEALLAAALRNAGLPARWVSGSRTVFPQPRRATETKGSSFAVTRSFSALEIPVARALPGAEEALVVGRDCRIERANLVVQVGDRSLACRPPSRFRKTGAKVPAWWFSAYEELGGGTAWHDGLDDNGTYYWTVDLLRTAKERVKVLTMGKAGDPSQPRFHDLVRSSGLLDVEELTIYWNLLPVAGGRAPVAASLHFPVSPDELRAAIGRIAAALARAKQAFDASRDFYAVWKHSSRDRAILY